MSDDLVEQAIKELQELVRCVCHEAYTGRGLHDPNCDCDSAPAVKVVADRIKELQARAEAAEARLAQAQTALNPSPAFLWHVMDQVLHEMNMPHPPMSKQRLRDFYWLMSRTALNGPADAMDRRK